MSKEVSLQITTRELCHEFYRYFENDPDIYMDMSLFKPYQYSAEQVDRFFDAKQGADRVMLTAMVGGRPVGEVQLKRIDWEKRQCELSIHMQNDFVKGKGYGTQAERLALEYAFDVLGMQAVNADAVLKNRRSQHILEKVGFRYVSEDETFKYYRYERRQ